MKRIILLLLICLLAITMPVALAHSGRTDSSGGHHDYHNKSGLGDYHYHHGYSAHLHEGGVCPYQSSTSQSKSNYESSSSQTKINYEPSTSQVKNSYKSSNSNYNHDDFSLWEDEEDSGASFGELIFAAFPVLIVAVIIIVFTMLIYRSAEAREQAKFKREAELKRQSELAKQARIQTERLRIAQKRAEEQKKKEEAELRARIKYLTERKQELNQSLVSVLDAIYKNKQKYTQMYSHKTPNQIVEEIYAAKGYAYDKYTKVWINDKSPVYHKTTCHHLKNNVYRPINIYKVQGKRPCGHCRPQKPYPSDIPEFLEIRRIMRKYNIK